MSDFTPNIKAFCCHYTSQQTCAGFPDSVSIFRVPCTGKIQVSALLQAFEDGADAVYVVGCPVDSCHNVKGSQRAAKRVLAVKQALTELDVEAERIEMFHLERGFHPEFVGVAQEMDKKIQKIGPSPLKGESE
jgi:coenzyme F420-reducing hydrogenase delta subunit